MKNIYIVNQTQPEEGYNNTAIYACSTYEIAKQRARKLNKKYGSGCVFSDGGDFLDIADSAGTVHFYTVAELKIDENFVS